MYDVIVIGARCAGAATAMLLTRKGHKVLLVDRAHFPSEIPRGHFVHRHGPRRLSRWGLLDKIVASNCPAVTTQVMDAGDFPLVGINLERCNFAGAGDLYAGSECDLHIPDKRPANCNLYWLGDEAV
jgi:2-polyprenyl-6-methoxyphenol hydroxylase-like FAD-dependent oxidoreductase